jgi:hypothetical protein
MIVSIKDGRNSNLHQRLLALGVPIRQTETTSCAPYHEVNPISNIPDGEITGQHVRFQGRYRVDGITRK